MSNYKVLGGDQREYGPVSADEVRQWIGDGRLNVQSLARAESSPEWKPLADFPEFADALCQPKSPPQISGAFVNPADWTNQILAREPELRLGECLRSGVSFFTANAGFVLGAVFLTWLLNVIMALPPVLGDILHLLFSGVVTGGLYLACLRRMRGEPVSIGGVFDGFKLCFLQLMLAGAISQLLTGLGFLACFLPGIYLTVVWIFALPLVVDKRIEFWSAMELSRKVVTRVWFEVFLMLVLVFLPLIGAQALRAIRFSTYGFAVLRAAEFDAMRLLNSLPQHIAPFMKLSATWGALTQVALLVCQFFAVGALLRAYENLFGSRKS